MYYNSNQNSNDYYSSYKKEMSVSEEYETTNSLRQIVKVGLGVLLLGFLGVGSVYLVNYLSTEKKEKDATTVNTSNELQEKHEESLPKIIIDKKSLPQSIQLQKSQVEILKEIQLNATDSLKEDSPFKSKEHNAIKNKVIALPETSNMNVEDINHIVEIILNKQKVEKHSTLEEELLHAEIESSPKRTLQETNHYNKVVLSSNKEDGRLNRLIQNSTEKEQSSSYEKSLKSESSVRLSEMRIIVVKRGDTLSKLAKKAYGDIHAYDKIFKANPEIIKNPDEIFVGQKIRIPS
jgi:hypothetical protein